VCDIREQKYARPRVDALTAPTSNKDSYKTARYIILVKQSNKLNKFLLYV
jgi:hypothetical protein